MDGRPNRRNKAAFSNISGIQCCSVEVALHNTTRYFFSFSSASLFEEINQDFSDRRIK